MFFSNINFKFPRPEFLRRIPVKSPPPAQTLTHLLTNSPEVRTLPQFEPASRCVAESASRRLHTALGTPDDASQAEALSSELTKGSTRRGVYRRDLYIVYCLNQPQLTLQVPPDFRPAAPPPAPPHGRSIPKQVWGLRLLDGSKLYPVNAAVPLLI